MSWTFRLSRWSIHLLALLLLSCQGKNHHHAWKAAISGVRGGSIAADDNRVRGPTILGRSSPFSHFAVVSTIVVRGENELDDPSESPELKLQPLCALFPSGVLANSPIWNGRLLTENNLPLWHSLALLSDLVVLVFDSKGVTVSSDLVRALVAGFRQRILSAGLPKGRLLVLMNAQPEQDVATWNEYLAHKSDALLFSPDLLNMLVANRSSFSSALQDILLDFTEPGVSGMLDATAFPSLLQQVYLAKGGILEEGKYLLEELTRESLLSKDNADDQMTERFAVVEAANNSTTAVVDAFELPYADSDALSTAMQSLEAVQSRQEDNWLDPGSLPIDFSGMVNPILERLEAALQASSPGARNCVEQQIGNRLLQLHQTHLKYLRDYFGTMYETLLDQNLDNEAAWQAAAHRVSEAFRKAGQDSIPLLAREGGVFRDMDLDYVSVFSGLLTDMVAATELRKEDTSYLDDNDDACGVTAEKPKRIAKWYEKLAARAIVFGVNYVQGWLAWQGVKRAALERERNMPKFPLF